MFVPELCSHCLYQAVDKCGTTFSQAITNSLNHQTCYKVAPTSHVQTQSYNIATILRSQVCNYLFTNLLQLVRFCVCCILNAKSPTCLKLGLSEVFNTGNRLAEINPYPGAFSGCYVGAYDTQTLFDGVLRYARIFHLAVTVVFP